MAADTRPGVVAGGTAPKSVAGPHKHPLCPGCSFLASHPEPLQSQKRCQVPGGGRQRAKCGCLPPNPNLLPPGLQLLKAALAAPLLSHQNLPEALTRLAPCPRAQHRTCREADQRPQNKHRFPVGQGRRFFWTEQTQGSCTQAVSSPRALSASPGHPRPPGIAGGVPARQQGAHHAGHTGALLLEGSC